MITKVFSLYDGKAKAFGPPFHMLQRGQALRALQDLVNDDRSMVSRHPQDFVLYQIGDFDDSSGEYLNKVPHELVGMALDFKQIKPVISGGEGTSGMVEVLKIDSSASENSKKVEVA